MTREEREEAIEALCSLKISGMRNGKTRLFKALETAIEALRAEPCEDAVKREAVLNTLDTMDKALDENRTVESYKELLKECYKALPPVTPKPKTGKVYFLW